MEVIHLEARSVERLSPKAYPYRLLLNSLIMFGRVRNSCQFPWPPIENESPRFSMSTWIKLEARIPLPAVSESPIPAMMSMSPGRSLWTEVGGVELLFGKSFGSQIVCLLKIG